MKESSRDVATDPRPLALAHVVHSFVTHKRMKTHNRIPHAIAQ
ncbi:MAG TPA: hypothetical protein VGO68_04895 [Pyrinomonadaceae bacterium]|nr:hypothetical protein [Pyrinomonadaceae bacterium]